MAKLDSRQLDCIPYKISWKTIGKALIWPFKKIWYGCVMNIASCDCGLTMCIGIDE